MAVVGKISISHDLQICGAKLSFEVEDFIKKLTYTTDVRPATVVLGYIIYLLEFEIFRSKVINFCFSQLKDIRVCMFFTFDKFLPYYTDRYAQ